jgi:uncharacterized repeat protein (TIGR03803 family)
MNPRHRSFVRLSVLTLILASATMAFASGARLKVINTATFTSPAGAFARFAVDKNGNLYAVAGGGTGVCQELGGGTAPCGTVYRVSPPTSTGASWNATDLYNFQGAPNDGENSLGPVLLDGHGNIFGSTNLGGNGSGSGDNICGSFALIQGCGTIFELSPQSDGSWTESVLHKFQGTGDGEQPIGRLVQDPAGNLYGVTAFDGVSGAGLIFELSPPTQSGGAWTETVLYQFGQSSGDGLSPAGGLARDSKGNLYGTTYLGGGPCNCGTVYRLSPPSQRGGAWTETILYSFTGASDGTSPNSDLSIDSVGNLYGITTTGFLGNNGTVYQLAPPANGQTWTLTTLHAFQGNGDGSVPAGGVTLDKKGNLYGVTRFGGDASSTTGCSYEAMGCGTIYEISPGSSGWTMHTLHLFHSNDAVGTNPYVGLVFGRGGALYGSIGITAYQLALPGK